MELDKNELGFMWFTKSYWYDSTSKPSINIGYYSEDGGTSGEFSITWIELSGKMCPKLEVFSDSWKVLASIPEFINALEMLDHTSPSESIMVEQMVKLGFKDFTQYNSPTYPEEMVSIPMSLAKKHGLR